MNTKMDVETACIVSSRKKNFCTVKMDMNTDADRCAGLEYLRKKGLAKLCPDRIRIVVGCATCGIAAGGDKVFSAFEKKIKAKNYDIYLAKTGCLGLCCEEPLVNVIIPGKPLVIFHRVTENDAVKILESALNGGIYREKALCKIEKWDHLTAEKFIYGKDFADIPYWNELACFKPQTRLVLRNAGLINPEDIDEYIAVGGYSAMFKALGTMTSDEVIEHVKKSNIRGRGGAGFPTGIKWENTKKEKSDVKYIICNGDEGDPGAYMNRNEMESDPHMIIEGMIIGAYAIGAQHGFIYVRAEYPLAVERLENAVMQAGQYGFLGKNIAESRFSFNIHIVKGAGAFVCGEETALIASMEGNSGRPRLRPPFPSQHGLWGKPTSINNVETWCNIPLIIKKGGKWFAGSGTDNNSGTKVFSLVGKVKNTGLVEVPLGTSIKTVVCGAGRGGVDGKTIKAVQTGGPSGGCVPYSLFETPLDYDHMKAVGSIMGSGGLVVMDEDTCMVDTAKYFLGFTVEESCGKCLPCREGLKHMYDILNRITKGQGKTDDTATLEFMCETIKATSLCGLGQTAPNPVVTTLLYFDSEYRDHIDKSKCPAKVCTALISYFIAADKCRGCTICMKQCPVNAIAGKKGFIHVIDQNKCIACGTCIEVCPFDSIVKLSSESIKTPEKPVPVKSGK